MYNNKKSSMKIFIIYFTIQIAIALALYPLLPQLLNYPPDSIDNNFQSELGEMYYTEQYILLLFIIIFINSFVLYIQLHRINTALRQLEKKPSAKIITKVKYLCLYTPFIIYILEIAVPLLLLPTLFIMLSALPIAIVKISLIYILFFMLCATISFIFSKEEFKKILVYVHNDYSRSIPASEMPKSKFASGSLKFTMLQQFVPLILVIITLISLIEYSQSSKEIGNILYKHYKLDLCDTFTDSYYTYGSIKEKLDNMTLLETSHTYFIISEDSHYITSNNTNLSDFLVKYVLEKSNMQGGRAYDYYCVDAEATCIKINTSNNSNYYVGVYYSTANFTLLHFIICTGIFFFILSIVIIFYIISALVKDIKRVSSSLEKIVNDNTYNKKLPLTSNDEIKDLVVAFNDVQDMTLNNILQIKNNQSMLMEKERLASLGQMIGGIAHNLKTPIMSISGAAEGLTDLTKEYDISIGDPSVTNEDHHAIVKDMNEWIEKIKTHTSYMSDVITAVKGQAVAFSDTKSDTFTIPELLTHIDVLMKHELKNALIYLNTSVLVPDTLSIKGNINSLVQVINNIISNAIQAYGGATNKNIDFIIKLKENNLVFSIQDYGCGMPKKVQDKLFKEMITTKGKSGTGLGLFMSYSNIRAHFNGNMTFESKEGEGTRFDIIIPLN